MMFVKNMLTVCMLVGMVVWAKADFRELCPVSFLVVSESPSVLLYYVVVVVVVVVVVCLAVHVHLNLGLSPRES